MFAHFTAVKNIPNSNDIVLKWTTANEMNALKFEIERSTDGVNFYKVGEVPATGNTNTSTDYSWREKPSIAHLQYYYRLRSINTSGQYQFSLVLIVGLSTPAAYFSSESDTAYHYGFNGKIVLSTTDTVNHTISGTLYFDYVNDPGGVKHSIHNGVFKGLHY